MNTEHKQTCRNCGEWMSIDGVKGRCAAGGIAGWVWRDEGCNRWWKQSVAGAGEGTHGECRSSGGESQAGRGGKTGAAKTVRP